MTTVYVQAGSQLSAGDEFMVYSENIKVGQTVQIGKYIGHHRGKPVAFGVCIGTGDEEPGSPVTPTSGTQKANAWRKYRKIRVERIF